MALPPPKTTEQIEQQATTEVAGEIKSETDPLYGQIGTLQGQQNNAIQQIGGMFDALQPIVSGEAQAVHDSYQAAQDASRQIFEGAQQRMDQLANQRAAEAQALSQQMGGPVAVGEFMAGVQPDQSALAQLAPNALMHGLANAQAGEQQARAWSERVMPAMRTEQVANARSYYDDQIKDLNKQIASITSQSGALTNKRLNELQEQERTYALQREQAKLEKLKNDRDWTATRHQLHNDDLRLRLSQKQFGLSEAGVTGKYKGKATLAARKLTADEKLAAQKLGLSAAQYAEQVRHHQVTEGIQQQRANNAMQKKAMDIIDAVSGKTQNGITITRPRELDPTSGAVQAIKNPKVYVTTDKNGKKHYWMDENVKLTPQQTKHLYGSGYADNPQKLYNLLTGSNVPNAMALKLVRAKTGVSSFKPGQKLQYTSDDLHNVANESFNELRGIAIQHGFKPGKTKAKKSTTTQVLIDFILDHQ